MHAPKIKESVVVWSFNRIYQIMVRMMMGMDISMMYTDGILQTMITIHMMIILMALTVQERSEELVITVKV